MTVPTLDDIVVAGRTVLVRSDLNVPLHDGAVADDYRIRRSLPVIHRLLNDGARVVACSHLGRPGGVIDPSLSMRPVTERLGALGGFPVVQIDGVAGPNVAAAVSAVPDGTVAVLENTRFEAGETNNDAALSDGLAALADVFVHDAFGTAHRAHASTVGVVERLPSVAGPLLLAEVTAVGGLLENPDPPYVVVLGGAKVSDKLAVMKTLLPKVDAMLIGGGMCFTLLAAQGHEIGSSLVDTEMIGEVTSLLATYGDKIVLPVDVVAAEGFAEDAPHATVAADAIPAGSMGLDIGPKSVALFAGHLASAHSMFWNGPMGVFEWEAFRSGTAGVAEAIAASAGFSVIGGGDSVAAIRLLEKDDEVGHVSTGGGAGLELLEGKALPALAALERWSGNIPEGLRSAG